MKLHTMKLQCNEIANNETSILRNYYAKYLHDYETSSYETSSKVSDTMKLLAMKMS